MSKYRDSGIMFVDLNDIMNFYSYENRVGKDKTANSVF